MKIAVKIKKKKKV